MIFPLASFKGFAGLLSSGAWLSLAIPVAVAHNRVAAPYCFAVQDILSMFLGPANSVATGDRLAAGDVVSAIPHPPATGGQGAIVH